MKYQFICDYCDHHWSREIEDTRDEEPPVCPICDDKSILIIKGSFDYYSGKG